MTVRAKDVGGTLRTITKITARDSIGAVRLITSAKMRGPDNVLRLVYSGGILTVTVAPSPVSKTGGTSTGSRVLTTAIVTSTATGGTGPFTYSWARTSGDATVTANTPTAASTSFTATVLSDTSKLSTFTVTVTDTANGVTKQASVSVTLTAIDTTRF